MTKEEVIKEAYGENWEIVKESVNFNDGWCNNELFQDDDGEIIKCPSCSHLFHESKTFYCINSLERCPNCKAHVSQYEYHYKFINVSEDAQKRFGQWRPKILAGIENNNGWTKVESKNDLPTEETMYRLGFFESKDKFYQDNNICNLKTALCALKESHYTHYQLAGKPKSPIF